MSRAKPVMRLTHTQLFRLAQIERGLITRVGGDWAGKTWRVANGTTGHVTGAMMVKLRSLGLVVDLLDGHTRQGIAVFKVHLTDLGRQRLAAGKAALGKKSSA